VRFWYLPIPAYPLWPCLVAVIVLIPVSLLHERNWRRTLAAYAAARVQVGVAPAEWPSPDLRVALGLQSGLLVAVAVPLAIVTAIGIFAGLAWPARPFGFETELNFYDLPFLWSVIVAATAALVATVAVLVDLLRSPWRGVANCVRRAIYASPEVRAELFAKALEADPDVIAARESRTA